MWMWIWIYNGCVCVCARHVFKDIRLFVIFAVHATLCITIQINTNTHVRVCVCVCVRDMAKTVFHLPLFATVKPLRARYDVAVCLEAKHFIRFELQKNSEQEIRTTCIFMTSKFPSATAPAHSANVITCVFFTGKNMHMYHIYPHSIASEYFMHCPVTHIFKWIHCNVTEIWI